MARRVRFKAVFALHLDDVASVREAIQSGGGRSANRIDDIIDRCS